MARGQGSAARLRGRSTKAKPVAGARDQKMEPVAKARGQGPEQGQGWPRQAALAKGEGQSQELSPGASSEGQNQLLDQGPKAKNRSQEPGQSQGNAGRGPGMHV